MSTGRTAVFDVEVSGASQSTMLARAAAGALPMDNQVETSTGSD